GPVDGSESDVGDLVESAQLVHDQLADLAGWDLDLAPGPQLGLDLVDDALHRTGRYVPLGGGLHQAAEQLLAVEVLPAAVLLDHIEGNRLDPLVGGEALGALEALAPAPDRLTGIRIARVDHLQVNVTTIWALHQGFSFPYIVSALRRPRRGAPRPEERDAAPAVASQGAYGPSA